MTNQPDFVLETEIRTTPERLWTALTDGELTREYYIANARLQGDIATGNPYEYIRPDGEVMLSGTILEASPFSRLNMTFQPHWGKVSAASRNLYEIEQKGDACLLTISHFDIQPGQSGVKDGWKAIAKKLKTMLEKERVAA